MKINQTSGKRFAVALELLAEGSAISYSGVSFQVIASNVLVRRVESSWQPERVDAQRALEDLASADRAMDFLCKVSEEFRELVIGRRIETVLFVGYGMGGVDICIESEGVIHWEQGFPVNKSI